MYGSNNRGYLKDKEIISNIDFYDKSNVEYEKFDVAEDLKSIKCPLRNQCLYEMELKKNKGRIIRLSTR